MATLSVKLKTGATQWRRPNEICAIFPPFSFSESHFLSLSTFLSKMLLDFNFTDVLDTHVSWGNNMIEVFSRFEFHLLFIGESHSHLSTSRRWEEKVAGWAGLNDRHAVRGDGQTTTKGYQEFNFQVFNNIISSCQTAAFVSGGA